MDPRDEARKPGQGAGAKPVEEADPRETLRDRSGRSGPFRREDLPPVEKQDGVKNPELEPPRDFARRGDIETERPHHEGLFPDRGRSDEESGRPVQLGGKRHQKPEPTTETRRK
jgi:hypothetical protein